MSTEFDFENYRFYEGTTTISGFEVSGSSYVGWEEAYHGNAAFVFQKHGITTDFEINTLIKKMICFDDAGEFLLTETKTQLPDIAAFCLVLFDRIVCAEKYGLTFEEVFVMHEALLECNGYLFEGDERKEFAKKAAHARHKENREFKLKVFEWCDCNISRFTSMDDAAQDIAETFVPYKFRTVREWIGEWKKNQSAKSNHVSENGL